MYGEVITHLNEGISDSRPKRIIIDLLAALVMVGNSKSIQSNGHFIVTEILAQ